MSRFNRNPPKRHPKRRFLIVCEGEKSEPSYIYGVRSRALDSVIEVNVMGPCGATKKVVERAVTEKKSATQAYKRSGDRFELYDEIWCVFDVDDHRLLAEALDQAKANDIQVALSNPCFELWIVLHHRDHRKHVDRADLQSECKNHHKVKDKHVSFELLWPNYDAARRNAVALRKWQSENQRQRANPWTDFDLLIERLKGE